MKKLLSTYQSLQLDQVLDDEKFQYFANTQHSTQIEGSTLSEIETRLLLEEDLTPKWKALSDCLMIKDYHQALHFVLGESKSKRDITPGFIQEINSAVMKNTGNTYRTLFGEIDSRQGLFRKSNMGSDSKSFVHFEKIKGLIKRLCAKLNEQMLLAKTVEEQLYLSYDALFHLIAIYPFYSGNGRTGRLLMNYIQALFGLPLAMVHVEDKAAYFKALQASREQNDLQYFRLFMLSQYRQFLTHKIELYRAMERGQK